MNIAEEWRPIDGYEREYQVSSFGRIKSIARMVRSSQGKSRIVSERILKPKTSGTGGYEAVSLCRNGAVRTAKVHRLVALAFLGEPRPGQEARHVDGNHLNNNIENIKWGTHSENMHDKVRHGTHADAGKTHCNHGHAYNQENTYRNNGKRYCRECGRIAQRKHRNKSKTRM